MKVVIVGAGKLGMKVADALLGGDHAVTIIDTDDQLLQKISSHLDVMTINANAKETKTLKRINISSYDYLIAVTGNDETNIVIASFAKKLGCNKVIARVRDPEHMQQINFIKDTMGIDHIVNDDASPVLNFADDIHNFRNVCGGTALVDDSEGSVDTLSKLSCSGNGTQVGRYYYQLIVRNILKLIDIVVSENRNTEKMVNRDVEEALDLSSVKVHGENSVSTCGGQKVGNKFCRDRISCLCLAVLTCIAKVGHNCGDAACGSALEAVDSDKQLHEVAVNGLAGGLNDKYVRSANRLIDGKSDLAVRECLYLKIAERKTELAGYLFSKFLVCIAAENFNVLAMNVHDKPLPYVSHESLNDVYGIDPKARTLPQPPGRFSQIIFSCGILPHIRGKSFGALCR